MTVRTARQLRRTMTDAERVLWRHLRNRGLADYKFRRQAPFGPYVADFLCEEKKLVVELDGGQHASDTAADDKRTAVIASHGYRVIRFWNNAVLSNAEGVLHRILDALEEH